MIAAVGPSTYWYLARGTGAVALVLLTASVVLGILGSVRFAAARWPRFAVDTLHRDVSLVVLIVLAVHIVTSVLDTFASISLTTAVIPFVSSYRPFWLGLGTVAFDLMLALIITSLLRRRIGYRGWRAIHWLAYASWPVAVLHGLGTGTDTKVWWMLLLTIVCVAAVAVACWIRVGRAEQSTSGARTLAFTLTAATPLGLSIFTLAGPLQRGWARASGTPAKLLAPTRGTTEPVSQRTSSSDPWNKPFSGQLSGSVNESNQPTGSIVDLSMRVSGPLDGRLRMRLAGVALQGGGLSMTGSQVDLLAPGHPAVLAGRITSLEGSRFVAQMADAYGTRVELHGTLNINSSATSVSGSISGSPGGAG